MEIKLKLQPSLEPLTVEMQEGQTIEELLAKYGGQTEYRIYAASMDGRAVSLNTKIRPGSTVVFLDMRDPSGKQAYQNSVVALYIYAASLEIPEEKIVIANSLNRGLFTFISDHDELMPNVIENIEKRMREMVKKDVPMDQISNEFDLIAPSAGYIRNFDLKPCHGGAVIRIPQDTHPDGLPEYREDEKLYEAFRDEAIWNSKLGIRYYTDLNMKIRDGSIGDIIQVSEALHEKGVALLAEKIRESGKRIVLIAGPSSSGKTSFAKRLCTQIWAGGTRPMYLGTDDYFIDRKDMPYEPDGTQDFESLKAVDVDLFNRHMNDLLAGKEVDLPRFDFKDGVKVFGERIVKAQPGQVIVIEGIHGLNDALTPQISPDDKFRIYISPLAQIRIDDHRRVNLTDIRKLRRIIRDACTRGWSASETIAKWPQVRAGEDKNIFPFSDSADALFNSTQVYELAAVKAKAKPLLEAIGADEEQYTEAQRLLSLLEYVEELPADYEKYIPCNSVLREFIGGSTIA